MEGINIKNLLIGAIVALLFYFVAIWVLGLINLAIPSIIISLVAIAIFVSIAIGVIKFQ